MTTRTDRRDSRRNADQSSTSDEGRARTIVVLDPDPRARAVVVSALTAQGYRATGTADPAAAVRAARHEGADLVLTDLAMSVMDLVPRWERRSSDGDPGRAVPPVEDGYAVMCALHLDPASARHLAVIIRDGTDERAKAFRFAVLDYVPKPVQPGLLIERMDEVYQRLESPAPPNVLELIPSRPSRPPRRDKAVRPERKGPWEDADRLSEDIPVAVFHALPRGLRTTLIADSDAGSRAFLRGLLEPHGFTVQEAEDGESALAMALARRPWLILSEVNMPRLDGFEFCRRVRAHALLRHTPLIFYSSWDDYTERYLGLKLGADEYLSKLTPVRELLIRFQLILKRYSDLGTRTRRGPGMEGTIELIGATGMLQMCHLGRLSGTCTVRSGPQVAHVTMREGEIVSARCGGLVDREAIYELLSWSRGQFDFAPGEPGYAPPLEESFDYLLLEGCRRLDEAQKAEGAPAAS